jgi:hypothetical protein
LSSGGLSTISGVTDGKGEFKFKFNAEEVSGTHVLAATCGKCTQPASKNIDVKVDGLFALLPSQALYELVGGLPDNPEHPDNHYLTPAAKRKLLQLVNDYNNLFPDDSILHLNDASLVWGGLFDIKTKWKPSHYEHRRGTVIDVRANRTDTAIPPANYRKFMRIIEDIEGDYIYHPPGKPIPEHFHVRLIGVEE